MLDSPICEHFNKENWKTIALIHNINLVNKDRNLRLPMLGFKKSLFPYQAQGNYWCMENQSTDAGGCILADTVGFGKSVGLLGQMHMRTLQCENYWEVLDKWKTSRPVHYLSKGAGTEEKCLSDLYLTRGPKRIFPYICQPLSPFTYLMGEPSL